MELVGIKKDVMDILEKYMSSKLCANTVGQVAKRTPVMSRLQQILGYLVA